MALSVYQVTGEGIPASVATQSLAAVVADASPLGQHQPTHLLMAMEDGAPVMIWGSAATVEGDKDHMAGIFPATEMVNLPLYYRSARGRLSALFTADTGRVLVVGCGEPPSATRYSFEGGLQDGWLG